MSGRLGNYLELVREAQKKRLRLPVIRKNRSPSYSAKARKILNGKRVKKTKKALHTDG